MSSENAPSENDPSENGRQAYIPFAAAAAVAVLLVAAIVAWPRSQAGQPADAAGCPKTYLGTTEKPWVPANPVGVDGQSRLTPTRAPLRVTVCAYLHPTSAGKADNALTGSRKLGGDLAVVSRTLSRQRRGVLQPGCQRYGLKTDSDDYLVRVTFNSGTVWVAVPGDHCLGTTNGDFVSRASLRAYADTAYRSGRWSALAPPTATPSASVS